MDEEEMFDMHMCLVCHSTVVGLVNYINHKKYDCPGKRPPIEKSSQENITARGDNSQATSITTSSVSFSKSNNSSYNAGQTVEQENRQTNKTDVDLGTVISLQDDGNFPSATVVSDSELVATTLCNNDLTPNTLSSVAVSSSLQSNEPVDKDTVLSNSYSTATRNVGSHSEGVDVRCQMNMLPVLSSSINGQTQNAISVDIQDGFSSFRTDNFSPGAGNVVDPNMVITATGRQNSTSDRPEDFFSSLALQSKTQQQSSVLGQGHVSRDMTNDNSLTSDLPISNILNNLNFSSDEEDIDFSFSEDDLFEDAFSDDTDSDGDGLRPPRNHTKGKWTPGQGPMVPQTGGKWKPGQAPPRQHTGGKWRPGQRLMHSTGGKWKPGQAMLGKMTDSTRKKKGKPATKSKSFNSRDQEYFCTACNLYFRNRFSYSSHCTGRQHKENVIIGKCYDNASEVETLGSIVTENLVRPQFETITTDYCESNDISTMCTEDVVNDATESNMNGKDSIAKQIEDNTVKSTLQNNNSAMECQTQEIVTEVVSEKGTEKQIVTERTIQNSTEEKSPDDVINNCVDDTPSQLLVCTVCDKKFYSKYVLARHLLSSYHINRAKGNTNTLKVLQQYHKYIVKLSPFQCAICPFYFNREEDLKDHLSNEEHVKQIKNVTGQLLCTLCKFTSFNNEDILKHLDTHQTHQVSAKKHRKPCIIKERHYKAECKYCGKVMHSRMHMKRHVNFKHAAELHPDDVEKQTHSKYRCLICMEVFWKYVKFNRHMAQKHSTDDEFYCKLCKKRVSDKSAFQRHVKGLKHQGKLVEESEKKRDKADTMFKVGKFEVVDPTQDSVEDHESDEMPQTPNGGMKIILRAVAKPRRKRKKKTLADTANKIYKCDHCVNIFINIQSRQITRL